jgi:hypothetical protein
MRRTTTLALSASAAAFALVAPLRASMAPRIAHAATAAAPRHEILRADSLLGLSGKLRARDKGDAKRQLERMRLKSVTVEAIKAGKHLGDRVSLNKSAFVTTHVNGFLLSFAI